jgi:hypothetical protein
MTEAEWLACDEPQTLIEFLVPTASERKARLLAAALCRHTFPLVADVEGQRAVETAEAYADGFATADDLQLAWQRAADVYSGVPPTQLPAPQHVAERMASNALQATLFAAGAFENYLVSCCICTTHAWHRHWVLSAPPDTHRPPYAVMVAWQTVLVREVFGNPFRPVAFDPAWRTSDAVARARSMYDSREFGTMPILADALQDAGCEDEQVLHHCRDTQQKHVRGCWVCDLVLGRA